MAEKLTIQQIDLLDMLQFAQRARVHLMLRDNTRPEGQAPDPDIDTLEGILRRVMVQVRATDIAEHYIQEAGQNGLYEASSGKPIEPSWRKEPPAQWMPGAGKPETDWRNSEELRNAVYMHGRLGRAYQATKWRDRAIRQGEKNWLDAMQAAADKGYSLQQVMDAIDDNARVTGFIQQAVAPAPVTKPEKPVPIEVVLPPEEPVAETPSAEEVAQTRIVKALRNKPPTLHKPLDEPKEVPASEETKPEVSVTPSHVEKARATRKPRAAKAIIEEAAPAAPEEGKPVAPWKRKKEALTPFELRTFGELISAHDALGVALGSDPEGKGFVASQKRAAFKAELEDVMKKGYSEKYLMDALAIHTRMREQGPESAAR